MARRVLRLGLCEPAGILTPPRAGQGTENPDAIGREREHVRCISGQAKRHALADLQLSASRS